MGNVHPLPGAPWPPLPDPAPTLNLTPAEVEAAAGGYKRPGDQLRELHARGFTRGYIAKPTGKVVLERAHYEAVTRGQFGHAANEPDARPPVQPNRSGLKDFLRKKKAG
jgi:hypothetical protein